MVDEVPRNFIDLMEMSPKGKGVAVEFANFVLIRIMGVAVEKKVLWRSHDLSVHYRFLMGVVRCLVSSSFQLSFRFSS